MSHGDKVCRIHGSVLVRCKCMNVDPKIPVDCPGEEKCLTILAKQRERIRERYVNLIESVASGENIFWWNKGEVVSDGHVNKKIAKDCVAHRWLVVGEQARIFVGLPLPEELPTSLRDEW